MGKKHRTLLLLLGLLALPALGRNDNYFPDKDLTTVGVYYYPEQWNASEWDRDFKKMAELGFEFTHIGEFAWAQLEPEEGVYRFAWLDKAIELAAKNKLKVILCTSTATPPVWLTRKYPEILITNENGTKLDHGARQHASFSNPLYKELSLRMIVELAKRYGKDNRIIGWQLDNEPAVQYDYGPAAEKGFRNFLRQKYGTIDSLNAAWGTAFWSQVYSRFDEITLPKLSMMFMNPHQIMDYRRFAAQQTTSFLDSQSNCIKQYAIPQQFVTSNFIPNYEEGHIGDCKELDFYSYTRYMVFGDQTGVGVKGFRVGDPLRISYANDFFRPINGIYGVMELQPGQVNWGEVNAQPLPGAVRLWLWSVFAGGSDFTCAYRFRQPLAGMEQYHYGIVGTDGVTTTRGGLEYSRFIQEINLLRKAYYAPRLHVPASYKARQAAILFNHENAWNIDRQKQNKYWDTEAHIQHYYAALKSFGAPVDVIREKEDFRKYPFLIVPAYQLIDDGLVARWKAYAAAGGHLVFTCRTGQKDRFGRFFEGKFGYKLFDLIGAEFDFFDLQHPESPGCVRMDNQSYQWYTWGEVFIPDKGTEVWGTYQDDFYTGKAAIIHHTYGKGTVTYVGVDSKNGDLEKEVLKKVYNLAHVPVLDLPRGVLVEYRNGFGIALNYADTVYQFPLPANAQVLIGKNPLSTTDVLVWKEK
ncbi:MAG: beta-galactosidase [Bacteroidota bacterium]|nr:beta-galactosidase [Bacteroidota bacterium]